MKQGIHQIESLAQTLFDEVRAMSVRSNGIAGVPTGLADLDLITGGLRPGDLVVLGARPSMGKSALAIQIATHVAVDVGLPVAMFSLAAGAGQVAMRVVAALGNIDPWSLRTGTLIEEEWSRLSATVERVRGVGLYIDGTPDLTPGELRSKAQYLVSQCGGLGLVVVDYLQLMQGDSSPAAGRVTNQGEITRSLKSLAKELRCPVLVLSQVDRSAESREDKRPMLADLRGSGAIKRDADVVMFLYREDYYERDPSEPGVAEVIVAKHHRGPTGTVKVRFLKRPARFEDLNAWC